MEWARVYWYRRLKALAQHLTQKYYGTYCGELKSDTIPLSGHDSHLSTSKLLSFLYTDHIPMLSSLGLRSSTLVSKMAKVLRVWFP